MKNKKFLIIFFILFLMTLTGASCQKREEKISMPEVFLKNKKVVLIVAFQNYQDLEYNGVRKVLEGNGAEITIASSSKGEARGVLGGKILVEKNIKEIDLNDFDALVFIGGPGASEYFENKDVHQLVQEAVKKEKILGAICISPVILAKAGILFGKKATVWSSLVDKSPIEELKKNGAIYLDEDVVVDGKIVTANGPKAAEKFAQAIVNLLK
ncbi:MAG: DJ-1/PfpI family protein [Patescibacteria group bacterium]